MKIMDNGIYVGLIRATSSTVGYITYPRCTHLGGVSTGAELIVRVGSGGGCGYDVKDTIPPDVR